MTFVVVTGVDYTTLKNLNNLIKIIFSAFFRVFLKLIFLRRKRMFVQ